MHISQVFAKLEDDLANLRSIDFGYPLGENRIQEVVCDRSAEQDDSEAAGCVRRWLSSIYEHCDGISLPDVRNGYFIAPLSRVIRQEPESRPTLVITAEGEYRVVSFGSTGDGCLFVVICQNGEVWLLPPGPLREGIYDGRFVGIKVLAGTIDDFLSLLSADVAAFVRNNRKHKYLSDR